METETIRILRTKKIEDNQLVLVNESIVCKFLWFIDDDHIDLQPIDNITILCVHKRNWYRLSLFG